MYLFNENKDSVENPVSVISVENTVSIKNLRV